MWNDLDVSKQYQIKISNRSVALQSLGDREDINRAVENTKQNIKVSTKDSLSLYE